MARTALCLVALLSLLSCTFVVGVHDDAPVGFRPVGAVHYGSVEVDVRPPETTVTVDGEALGAADDFDGWPSYLFLEAGRHTLTLSLPGYRTLTYTLDITHRSKIVVNLEMVRDEMDHGNTGPDYVSDGREERGRLEIVVSPLEASIYINGEFAGTGTELARLHGPLQFSSGHLIIEAVAPGYRTIKKEVDLPSGEYLRVELGLELEE